ncbi:MAG: serine hydrolase domain-containing protein [Pseudomonadota bacterium]|nr:serine hydrolase domain-containing protein [Pseudomonadota bacterium]
MPFAFPATIPARTSINAIKAAFAAGLVVWAVPSSAEAGELPEGFADRVGTLLDASFKDDGPGAIVVVAKDGEVVYRAVRGMADIEGGVPVSPDTLFRYASITKQFAAATLLKLAEEGKLSLEDPLSKFLPDYPAPGRDVTVRQLLNHTSGIKSYTSIPGWMTEENTTRVYTTETLIDEFKDQPQDFPAGTKYAYNNSGYVLVGAVIEAVTGKPWNVAMIDEVTGDLAVPSIDIFLNESEVPNTAIGYSIGEGGKTVLARKIHATGPGAAGALRGTADDLIRWTEALNSGKVLSDAWFEAMVTPTALPGGESRAYGFGLGVEPVKGHRAIGHSGGIFGFSTDVLHLPDDGISVAMLANSDRTRASLMVARIAMAAAGDPFERFTAVKPDMAAVSPLFGKYAVGEGTTREFYERDGKLYTLRSGSSESEVFAAEGGRFFYGPTSLTWFDFTTGADGKPVMQMYPNGAQEPETASYAGPIKAVETVTIARDVLQQYAGSYTTEYGKAVFTLDDDDTLSLTFAGQPPAALMAIADATFKTAGVDATITFAPSEEGMTMTLSQGPVTLKAVRDPDA